MSSRSGVALCLLESPRLSVVLLLAQAIGGKYGVANVSLAWLWPLVCATDGSYEPQRVDAQRFVTAGDVNHKHLHADMSGAKY